MKKFWKRLLIALGFDSTISKDGRRYLEANPKNGDKIINHHLRSKIDEDYHAYDHENNSGGRSFHDY